MDEIDKLHARANLLNLSCALKHHPSDTQSQMQAVDYIYQGWGTDNGTVAEIKTETIIPICKDCAESLSSGEWGLQYCMCCGNSKWIWKLYSCREINFIVQWTPFCPSCRSLKT